MEAYRGGDPRAFRALHERLTPRLHSVILGYVRERSVASDLLQTALLKAHVARERFETREDPDASVRVWYTAIARNVALDHLRAQTRARRHLADGVEVDGADLRPGVEAMVEDAQREAEVTARVQAALEQLSKSQREVIELHKLQGLPMSEVASRLAAREGAIRVRAHRAYRALAALLGAAPRDHAESSVETRAARAAKRRDVRSQGDPGGAPEGGAADPGLALGAPASVEMRTPEAEVDDV